MAEFRKLEKTSPEKALEGRSKCLQLISTIYSRQGKYRESIALSTEAMDAFRIDNDTNGYLGLIYNSLGMAYEKLGMQDSSEYFHRLAWRQAVKTKVDLPAGFLPACGCHRNETWQQRASRQLYDRALAFPTAQETGRHR
jgi:tetratricopeptide (TPR) repeat protein